MQKFSDLWEKYNFFWWSITLRRKVLPELKLNIIWYKEKILESRSKKSFDAKEVQNENYIYLVLLTVSYPVKDALHLHKRDSLLRTQRLSSFFIRQSLQASILTFNYFRLFCCLKNVTSANQEPWIENLARKSLWYPAVYRLGKADMGAFKLLEDAAGFQDSASMYTYIK